MTDRMFEAVSTNPGYGMADVIYNNLLNLILGTVIHLIRCHTVIRWPITMLLLKRIENNLTCSYENFKQKRSCTCRYIRQKWQKRRKRQPNFTECDL